MTEREWLSCDQSHLMRDWLFRVDSYAGTTAGERVGNRISDRKVRLACAAMLRAVWPGLIAPDSRPCVERLERIAEGAERPIPENSMGRREDGMGILTDNTYWTFNNASVAALNLGAKRADQAAIVREVAGNIFRPAMLPPGPAVRCEACAGRGSLIGDLECIWCEGSGRVLDVEGRYEDSTKDCPHCDPVHCESCKGKGTIPGPSPVLTPTVLSLARAAYDEREDDGTLDAARLLVLSDALEEAGCTDEALLMHLRGREPYRECQACDAKPGSPRLCDTCLANRARGWMPLDGPHVRGCWAVDLILSKE